VRYLVEEAQADANLLLEASIYGSVLAAAAYSGDLEKVKYLVEEAQMDAHLLLDNGNFGSALAAAAAASRRGQLKVVKYLVEEAQADVNLLPVSDGDYASPLGHAVEEGDMEIVRYLVEEGKADVNLQFRFKGSSTALDVALLKATQSPEELHKESRRYTLKWPKHFQAIAEYLISKGAVASQ
jgi:ankyrin repeat protein